MSKLPSILIAILSVALISPEGKATEPEPVPEAELLPDSTHLLVYWDARDRDELSKLARRAPQQFMHLATGVPMEVTADLFHEPVRVATSKVSVSGEKAIAVLETLDEPFLKYGDWQAFRSFVEERLLGVENPYLEAQQGPVYDILAQLARRNGGTLQLTLRTRVFLEDTHVETGNFLPAETTTHLFLERTPEDTENRVRSTIETQFAQTVGVFGIQSVSFSDSPD